jgi:NAD(P)-dependent dehydrogenase (short-subunit alcohol dehydrogenase family)
MHKTVVVSGANTGIGLALTEALISMGNRVAAIDLTGDNLAACIRTYPHSCVYFSCDVTDLDTVQITIDTVRKTWGTIDILINNACLAIFAGFETKKIIDTRREFEVNYFGYLNMIQAVLPIMKAQGYGVIHNVSSGVGITGFPGIYGYASTKGAIEALTRTLAIELSPYGITVNMIHPPLTRTKSAAPLGIPEQMMADPQIVGKKLASKIGSRKPLITPDFATTLGLFANRHFPDFMGRFLAKMTERANPDLM